MTKPEDRTAVNERYTIGPFSRAKNVIRDHWAPNPFDQAFDSHANSND
jgi:hypothetical protein